MACRRGLMRLQSESSKRQSLHGPPSLDLSRSSSFHLSGVSGTPKSSKRASFTPLTGNLGNQHRRTTSDFRTSPQQPSFALDPASPNVQTVTFPPPDSSPPRRLSALFGATQRSPSPDTSAELESLRRELKNLRDNLEETRAELSEAIEAKEASDACAKALREFINMNNVGNGGSSSEALTFPPMPTEAKQQPAANGSWGFGKLFRQPPVPLDTTVPNPSVATVPSAASPGTTTPQGPPLSRKIGSFFGSRSNSISSTSGILPLQSNSASSRASIDKRESTYSYTASDRSSSVEPISPVGEEDPSVKVREASEGGNSPDLVNETKALNPVTIAAVAV